MALDRILRVCFNFWYYPSTRLHRFTLLPKCLYAEQRPSAVDDVSVAVFQSHLFFVLEFLNGGDLNFHLTQAGRFDADRTRFYACELVCGLRFLHKRGVIYR